MSSRSRYALKHVGVAETRLIEEPLLEVAKHVTPGELHAKVRDGVTMGRAKPDGRAAAKPRPSATEERVPGQHLTGFLDIETGAKLNTILKNLSVPRDADDTGHRRNGGWVRWTTSAPPCWSMACRPTTASAPTSTSPSTPKPSRPWPSSRPARPSTSTSSRQRSKGSDRSGPASSPTCSAGPRSPRSSSRPSARTSRFSTSAAPNASPPHDKPKPSHCRQGGTCAAPACWHPISHNHHLTWWSHGGRTDLDNLIGLCRTCHTLVHSGRLELARGSPHQALAA